MERKTNVKVVTICVFIATFMTAIEGTIVTTAMPTIVGSLHGMEMMNWVFSIYLLTNAMLTPIYGKLADKVGRKPIFIFGTLLFIIGSLFLWAFSIYAWLDYFAGNSRDGCRSNDASRIDDHWRFIHD
ncbi:hypothetical protein I587_02437 [Enterococcus mundtii ATCC 882]|nr:hypothetical protein UAC_00260 [Enterococcus mundtii ATCC 882]EOU13880.1 hypothetical protein I587_02437 [Enterococcus mundtii ATCC 882]